MVKVIKKSFVVIGKEGSTLDGEGFIQKLWDDANSHFGEVAHLAKKDANGGIVGIWGAMSDISRSFKPWEDGFSKGLYLAGVECVDNAEAPDGWTKWIIPEYEYIVVENHKGCLLYTSHFAEPVAAKSHLQGCGRNHFGQLRFCSLFEWAG